MTLVTNPEKNHSFLHIASALMNFFLYKAKLKMVLFSSPQLYCFVSFHSYNVVAS